MITTANAILQSYKRVLAPIIALAAGALVKAASAYLLIGESTVREMGAPISTLLFNATVLIVDFAFMYRAIPKRSEALKDLPKCLFSGLIAVAMSYAVFCLLERATDSAVITFGAAFGVAATVYFLLAYAMGVVSKEDISVISIKKRS
jgi:ABC-type Co2+ transport system permease subunit